MSCRIFFASKTIIPGLLGTLVNGMTALCWGQIIQQQKIDDPSGQHQVNMYKFFLVKALNDVLFFVNDIFYVIGFFCDQRCKVYLTPYYVYYMMLSYAAFGQILEIVSPLMEIAATFGINFIFLPKDTIHF
jgi:hypothetical protein